MSTKTILFADDSATMRHIVEKTFAAEPYDVVCVPSGEGAIAKAKEIGPNVIIVDAGMPGFSGYDVCKTVRNEPSLSRTPVIIMSGVSNLYDEARGREAGVTEHMKKPFDTGLLIEMVTGLAATAPAIEDVPLEEVTEPEEDIFSPVSETPLAELEPVDATSEEPEPIPLVSDDAPSYQMGSLTSLDAPLDFEEPVEVEEPAEKQTADYVLPSSPPAVEPSAESTDELLPVSEEPPYGGEADLGVEEPLGLEEPSIDSDVSPIEIKPREEEASSGSFHVGTLAELAQMDSAGHTLETEPHEDAIEISPSAGSLASLAPQLSEHLEPEPSAAPEPEEVAPEPDVAPEPEVGPPSSIPDFEDIKEAPTPISAAPEEEDAPPQIDKAASASDTEQPSFQTTDAVRERAADAASEIAEKVEGITSAQAAAIQTLTREIIERVVWEVVPDLAEIIIKEELSKLLEE